MCIVSFWLLGSIYSSNKSDRSSLTSLLSLLLLAMVVGREVGRDGWGLRSRVISSDLLLPLQVMYVISLWKPCWVAMVGVTVAVQAGRGGYDDGVDLIRFELGNYLRTSGRFGFKDFLVDFVAATVSGSSNISINHRGAAQRFCCVVVLSGTGRVRTNLKASVVLRVETCTCGRGIVLIPLFFHSARCWFSICAMEFVDGHEVGFLLECLLQALRHQ